MKKEKLVLNFLVFADKVKDGALQANLLQKAADLGFTQVEIRREYFRDINEEKTVIESEAKRLGLDLFYSVPDEVYVNGKSIPS